MFFVDFSSELHFCFELLRVFLFLQCSSTSSSPLCFDVCRREYFFFLVLFFFLTFIFAAACVVLFHPPSELCTYVSWVEIHAYIVLASTFLHYYALRAEIFLLAIAGDKLCGYTPKISSLRLLLFHKSLAHTMKYHRSVSGSIILRQSLKSIRDPTIWVPISIVRQFECELCTGTSSEEHERRYGPRSLVQSLSTMNPLLFHAEMCQDHQLPTQVNGHPFASMFGIEMKKLALARGYKSLYWLSDKFVPAQFGVTIQGSPPHIVFSDATKIRYYVNADETSDPTAFSQQSCLDFSPRFFPQVPQIAESYLQTAQQLKLAVSRALFAKRPAAASVSSSACDSPSLHAERDPFPRGIDELWFNRKLVETFARLKLYDNGACFEHDGYVNAADICLPREQLQQIFDYKPLHLTSMMSFSGTEAAEMACNAVLYGSPKSTLWGTADAVRIAAQEIDRNVPSVSVAGMGIVHCVQSSPASVPWKL